MNPNIHAPTPRKKIPIPEFLLISNGLRSLQHKRTNPLTQNEDQEYSSDMSKSKGEEANRENEDQKYSRETSSSKGKGKEVNTSNPEHYNAQTDALSVQNTPTNPLTQNENQEYSKDTSAGKGKGKEAVNTSNSEPTIENRLCKLSLCTTSTPPLPQLLKNCRCGLTTHPITKGMLFPPAPQPLRALPTFLPLQNLLSQQQHGELVSAQRLQFLPPPPKRSRLHEFLPPRRIFEMAWFTLLSEFGFSFEAENL
jgi:hypothetical protein